ncbi:MAG: glycosyl hydrolase family 28 protein [Candidatus Cryptobacteroides sp.]
MNRFTRILGGLAALAAISCSANDARTTVRYSILEDPETTPADIRSWEAYAFVFSGGKCTYSGYWQELSELTGITAGMDDLVTVVAAESMENLGLPVLEPGEEASLYRFVTDDLTSSVPRLWSATTVLTGNDDTLFQFLTPLYSEIRVVARNAPAGLDSVKLRFSGAANNWHPFDGVYGVEEMPFDLEIPAGEEFNVVLPPSAESLPALTFSLNGRHFIVSLPSGFALKKSCRNDYIIDFKDFASRSRVAVRLSSHNLLAPSAVSEQAFDYEVPAGNRDHYSVSFISSTISGDAQVHKALCSDARKHGGLWNDWDNSRAQRDTMSFTIIDTDFPARFRIRKNNGSFSKVEVRPSIYGIEPVLCGDNTVEIIIPSADKGNVSVEFDGDRYHNLFIYASEPDSQKPDASDPDVLYYGPGIHQPGTINLEAGQTLYIDYGAKVYANVVTTGSNITIAGHGILSGEKMDHKGDSQYSWGDFLIRHNKTGGAVRDFAIRDITMLDSPGWNLIIPQTDGVTVSGVKMISWELNGDGIDVVCCRDVDINNCFIRTYDDCVTLKRRFIVTPMTDVSNVRISNCLIWADYARGIVVGPEAGNYGGQGSIHGIEIADCIFLHHKRSLTDDLRSAFAIGQGSDGSTALWTGTTPPNGISGITVRNLTFDNIDVTGRAVAIWQYKGTPKVEMSNVVFDGVNIIDNAGNNYPPVTIQTGGSFINGLEFRNFKINGKALTADDVSIDLPENVTMTIK